MIFGGEGISRYRSTDGHLLMEYPTQSYNSGAAVLGDTLLAMSADGKETVLYDLKTGRQTGGSIYDGLSFLTALGLDDEGVYLGDATGIYRQTAGGTIWEKLVDGEPTSLSMPTLSLSGLTSDGEGGFYALLQGEDDVRLLHYCVHRKPEGAGRVLCEYAPLTNGTGQLSVRRLSGERRLP